ncbi:hypothetical protein [Tropicimonas aquimaris]|uniref:Uncharacterized protein n=1 Tax=Tropicimonas aquimaris TaxID=914152 RepID=A0ABW3IY99_9RHOB
MTAGTSGVDMLTATTVKIEGPRLDRIIRDVLSIGSHATATPN